MDAEKRAIELAKNTMYSSRATETERLLATRYRELHDAARVAFSVLVHDFGASKNETLREVLGDLRDALNK